MASRQADLSITRCASIWCEVARQAPRVQCLTNTVAQPITANLLLAAGARVSMATHPAEIAAMARGADAVLINLGTLDAAREAAVPLILAAMALAQQPLILDPVFVELSPVRLALARSIVARGPVIVRGNPSEVAALRAAVTPAQAMGSVWAVTGAVDAITDGVRTAHVANGHPWMTAVTGLGCAAGALVAACAAVEPDRLAAATTALLALGIAGERAAAFADGPGSFAVRLIDMLARLDAATFLDRARLS
jgi:hydroxyethylthiazole kinase